jgi:hypothetical protein
MSELTEAEKPASPDRKNLVAWNSTGGMGAFYRSSGYSNVPQGTHRSIPMALGRRNRRYWTNVWTMSASVLDYATVDELADAPYR